MLYVIGLPNLLMSSSVLLVKGAGRTTTGAEARDKDRRAIGRPKVAPKIEARVRAERATGTGIHKIARTVSVGVGTVQRMVAAG